VLGSTKEQRSNRRLLWSGALDCPVCHRTVSGAPEDFNSNSSPSGKSRASALKFTGLSGVHRTVSGAPKKTRLRNSPASGFHSSRSAIIHRTCPVQQRGNDYFRRQRLPAAHLLRASARRDQARPCWRTGHSTVHVRCATRHQGGPRRQSSNGRPNGYLVAWLSHRIVWCTIRQTAPPTVKFGGWGYKYPNHPTIHGIQVFQLSTTIQELAFIAKHT
jgi:hypothetical protein